MRKLIHLLMIAVIVGSTMIPYTTAIAATLSDWVDNGYVKIKGDILPPSETRVGSVDGAGVFFRVFGARH